MGCGEDYRPGYLNMDAFPYKGVDLVADFMTHNFPENTFDEILAKDILEHVYYADAKRMIRRCLRWLKPGGVLVIHTTNTPYIAGQLASGGDYTDDFHLELLKWMYGTTPAGEDTSPYRCHYWGYSRESLSKIMEQIGYRVVDASITCNGFGLLVIGEKRCDGEFSGWIIEKESQF